MIQFFTNLDEAKPYVNLIAGEPSWGNALPWPKSFGIPRKGDRIAIPINAKKAFDLAVVEVTFHLRTGIVSVELAASPRARRHHGMVRAATRRRTRAATEVTTRGTGSRATSARSTGASYPPSRQSAK